MYCDFVFNVEVYVKFIVGYKCDDVIVSVLNFYFGYVIGINLMFFFVVGVIVGLFSECFIFEILVDVIVRYCFMVVINVFIMMGKLLNYDDVLCVVGYFGIDMLMV